MQPNSNPDQIAEDLVLETLPSGEAAWLRPERRPILLSRYWLTAKGRAAIHDEAEA